MTRQDFVAIARTLRDTRPQQADARSGRAAVLAQDAALDQWRDDVEALMDLFAVLNPRFDRPQFRAAVMAGRLA